MTENPQISSEQTEWETGDSCRAYLAQIPLDLAANGPQERSEQREKTLDLAREVYQDPEERVYCEGQIELLKLTPDANIAANAEAFLLIPMLEEHLYNLSMLRSKIRQQKHNSNPF